MSVTLTLSLLVVVTISIISLCSAATGLLFAEIVSRASFPPRENCAVHRLALNQTYTDVNTRQNVTVPAGSAILFGGEFDCSNDVWIAPANDYSAWSIISGAASFNDCEGPWYPSAYPFSSFAAVQGATYCADTVTDRLYMLGGWSEKTAFQVNDVWSSVDHLVWSKNNATANPTFPPSNSAACGVLTDGAGTILYVAGNQVSSAPWNYNFMNSVWSSSDRGQSWVQLPDAPFLPRQDHMVLVDRIKPGVDVVYVIGGTILKDNAVEAVSDIWSTSDAGKTWKQVTAAATFVPRSRANGVITPDGVMVIVAGGEILVNGSTENWNFMKEVWISFDHGNTFVNCSSTDPNVFIPREHPAVEIDGQGFLHVIAGRNSWPAPVFSDVWKSKISTFDTKALAAACGVTLDSIDLRRTADS